MTDDLQVRKRPGMAAGSGRFAKKKSHIQESPHQFLFMAIEFVSQWQNTNLFHEWSNIPLGAGTAAKERGEGDQKQGVVWRGGWRRDSRARANSWTGDRMGAKCWFACYDHLLRTADSLLYTVKVIFQTNNKSRFATMVVATFSLLTVIALAAAMIMTPYSAWVRLDIY